MRHRGGNFIPMKPLRILHSEAATSFGGQENRIFKEMCAMRSRGHDVQALCQPHAKLAERLQQEGFQVHTMLMDGPVNFLKGLFRIRRILRQGQFDVLNTHSRRDTVLAGLAARLAGTPLIVRTRHLAKPPKSLFSYTVIPHRVSTVSEHVRDLLLQKGVAPEHVGTIYSPIPLAAPVPQSTLRHELGLPAEAVVVGCVAVMREKKGHIALINAMRNLLMKDNVYLVLVGSGSPTLEKVQDFVRSKDLEKKVLFTGRREDIPNVLAGFDIFALATEQEASGTVFVEASAAGLPVIGTNVGGVSEMFEHGVTGILVPLADQRALSQALEDLVANPERRQHMGQAGMRAVRSGTRFTLEGLAQNTEHYYHKWLKEREHGK